jgi:hypothetical protein
MTSKTVSHSGILTNILPMNTKQALTLDPFPILNFKEASKKLMGIKIMQIYEETKKKKLFLVGWWVGVGVGLDGSQKRGVGERDGGWWASPE